jgi:hypothetical protein
MPAIAIVDDRKNYLETICLFDRSIMKKLKEEENSTEVQDYTHENERDNQH